MKNTEYTPIVWNLHPNAIEHSVDNFTWLPEKHTGRRIATTFISDLPSPISGPLFYDEPIPFLDSQRYLGGFILENRFTGKKRLLHHWKTYRTPDGTITHWIFITKGWDNPLLNDPDELKVTIYND